MNTNIKPDLIAKKVIRKLQKKHFKNQSKTEKVLTISKNFLINNWYILLIFAFVCFLLYLKYDENKKKKENMQNVNIEKVVNSKPRSILDFQQIQRVSPNVSTNIPKYLY